MRTLIPILLLLTAAAWGCGDENAESQTASTAPEAAPVGAAPQAAPDTAPPAGDVPGTISSRGEHIPSTPAPEAGAAAGAAGQIHVELPAGWQSEPPETSMRIGQAVIPGPGGPAQLAIFYFGPGQGGSVEANFERWAGQIEQAPGARPERGAFDAAGGLKVTWIDVAGTLQPSSMGMGPSTAQPGSRLLGAVVEGPGGPWFFKATGPEATLASAREPFLAMLRDARLP